MRRSTVAAFAIALLTACALASCGKGGYVVTTTATPSAPASGSSTSPSKVAPTHPHSRTVPRSSQSPPSSPSTPTRAQALAFAGAVDLTAADVPGFTPSSHQHSSSPGERRAEQQLRSCLGTSGADAVGGASRASTLAQASSPDFQLRRGIIELSVGSEVTVSHSSSEATAALAAIRSPRVRRCLSAYVHTLLSSQHYGYGARVSEVTLDSGTPPAPGTSGGFGWQVRATLALRGLDLPFYIDILGFVYGPAQVTLTSTGDVRAFPAAAQEQLFHTLLARARAHKF